MNEHADRCCVFQCYYADADCPVVKRLVKPKPCMYCGETESSGSPMLPEGETMKSAGTIVQAICDTGRIWADCPWSNKFFPNGFEYSIHSVMGSRLEGLEGEDAVDNGFCLFSPDTDCISVLVRVNEPDLFDAETLDQLGYNEGEIAVPFVKCEEILGVSHFKLIDVLAEQRKEEMADAFMVQVNARQYGTIEMFSDGKKYKEKLTPIPKFR